MLCGLVTKSCPTLETLWTVACQAPLSIGFSSKFTRVGCHFLLQGIFLTQGSDPGLLHCRQILYSLHHLNLAITCDFCFSQDAFICCYLCLDFSFYEYEHGFFRLPRGLSDKEYSKESACTAGDIGLILGSGRFPGEGNGNPLQYSSLGNPMDGGAWWATVHGVAKSQT